MAEYTGLDKRLQYLFQHLDSCKVISGYYYDGQMYKNSAHTELITGSTDCLYIDKSATTLYLYDGSAYEEVQGGGGGSTVTITPTLSTGTKIADYSIDGVSDSLYAPTGGGGATDLDDLTDVTITSPANGQALLYDFATSKWVNGTVQGGGSGSDGTVGVRIDKSFAINESKTYTYDELGITAKGYYILGIATNHSEPYGGWKWYGYLCYSGNNTNNYSYVKAIDSNNISVTMDSVNKTITIQNTNGNWAETFRIEVLPLHPKVEVEQRVISGYYNNGNFYEDSALTTLIIGNTKCLYIDLFTTKLYLFDGTNYIVAQGGGGGCGSSFEQLTITEFCDLSSTWTQE